MRKFKKAPGESYYTHVSPVNQKTKAQNSQALLIAWFIHSFYRLNPNNWFNELSDIEITLEECFLKKS